MSKPKSFTSSEAVIEELSNKIFKSGKTYAQIANEIGVSRSTVANVATRKTIWPRPATFFPLIAYFGCKLELN